MLDLFIILSIPFLLYEITILFFTKRYQNYIENLTDKIKDNGISKEDRPFVFFNFSYMMWTIIGLFTPLWSIFIGLLTLSIISALIHKKLVDKEVKIKQRKADSLLTIILIIFLLIRYFGN